MFRVQPHPVRTLSWWSNRRDQIDFEPPYQRKGRIWTNDQKAFLIDSILNGYDIPKIYMADFNVRDSPLNQAQKPYAVIDGKQRLEAIFDFFNGQLRLASDFKYLPDPGLELGGFTLKDLKNAYPQIADEFEQFNLDVVSVITDEEEKINELFVRLNSGKDLSGAEIRNAMSGKVPKLIRSLAQHEFFKSRIAFTVQRGQDRNTAAKLLLLEFRGRFTDTKRTQLDQFTIEVAQAPGQSSKEEEHYDQEAAEQSFVEEGWYAEHADVDRSAKRATKVLDQMTGIFQERDPLLRSQGPLVLYYWLVRNYGSTHNDRIRPFLVGFNKSREENRESVESTGEAKDQVLLHYNTLLRAINDQGALVKLYDILERRFLAFVKRQQSSGRQTLKKNARKAVKKSR